jgi:hypothetical protein
VKLVGRLLGKEIYSYDPGFDCTEEDLHRLLSNFRRIEMLRMISQCSLRLFNNDNRLEISGVPITNDILLDLAAATIKHSTDAASSDPSDELFLLSVKMCHKLVDKHLALQTTNPEEILMLFAYRQFSYQEKNFNAFARNYYLYKHLWKTIPSAKDIDVLSEIEKIVGVSFEKCLTFAYAALGNGDGHFWPYTSEVLAELGNHLNLDMSGTDFATWLSWRSGTYSDVLACEDLLTPFATYPILETKTKPRSDLGEVYIVISHQLLHNKITSGMYYALADAFRKEGERNSFREKFGYVFQAYVGQLLSYHFKKWKVIPEIRYRKGGKVQQDTVDWFLLKEDRLLMIEVKQSSIFLEAKVTAKMEAISRDLRTTLAKAATQLQTTMRDIQSRQYPELAQFNGVKHLESMIVLNDPLYNANTIGKQLIQGQVPSVDFNIHIINISDLEILLSNQIEKESLYDMIEYKSLTAPKQDFKEYTITMFPEGNVGVPFLIPYFDELFGNRRRGQARQHNIYNSARVKKIIQFLFSSCAYID